MDLEAQEGVTFKTWQRKRPLDIQNDVLVLTRGTAADKCKMNELLDNNDAARGHQDSRRSVQDRQGRRPRKADRYLNAATVDSGRRSRQRILNQ